MKIAKSFHFLLFDFSLRLGILTEPVGILQGMHFFRIFVFQTQHDKKCCTNHEWMFFNYDVLLKIDEYWKMFVRDMTQFEQASTLIFSCSNGTNIWILRNI